MTTTILRIMTSRRSHWLLMGAALGLLGCGKGEAPGAASSASAAQQPQTPLPAASSSSGAPAPQAGGLAVVARVSDAHLYSAGPMAVLVSRHILFTIDDQGFHQDPSWHKGFLSPPPLADVEVSGYDVTGVAPDALWIQAWSQGKGTSDPTQTLSTYRWAGKIWGNVQPLSGHDVLLGVVPFGKGKYTGLVLADNGGLRFIPGNTRSAAVPSPPTPLAEEADGGAPPAASASANPASPPAVSASANPVASNAPSASSASPALSAAPSSPPLDASPAPPPSASAVAKKADDKPPPAKIKIKAPFWSFMDHEDAGLFPHGPPVSGSSAGQIVLVGGDAANEGKGLLVERWAPGASKSVVTALPAPSADEGTEFAPLAAGGREAYVYGNGKVPYLVRFDGAAWAREAPPAASEIQAMSAAEDGSVVLVMAKGVFRRAPGDKTWTNVPLPATSGSPRAAVFVGKDLWVLTAGDLLGPSNKAPSEIAHLPTALDASEARVEVVRYPLTAACTSPFVVLDGHVSPAQKSFPEIEDLIKKTIGVAGVELLTEVSPKWTYVGAKVPSYAAANKLEQAMLAQKPKGYAKAYCHLPRAVKTIPLTP